MNYDRQITISVGNNRRDMVWKQTVLTVEELYKRLSTPVRGAETLQDYLHLKKSQQDDLKDVGGFVGGSLLGQRRKANNVTGRDIITLDFDNVPGWQTETIIGKMDELGFSYCIYSTRKHTPERPRLRVVIPTDRTMTPDEYEPCARRVAAHVGIGMADPTTFETVRLMYWPSCCCDSEFVYKAVDAPLISADALLGTYADWHDLTSWPVVPGATSYQKLAMKQGDPEEKQGLVGAFCRTYTTASRAAPQRAASSTRSRTRRLKTGSARRAKSPLVRRWRLTRLTHGRIWPPKLPLPTLKRRCSATIAFPARTPLTRRPRWGFPCLPMLLQS